MKARIYILLVFICATFQSGYSQSTLVDSLKNALKTEQRDTVKLLLNLRLSRTYNLQGDYLQALDYGVKSLNLAKQLESSSDSKTVFAGKKGEARAYIYIGNSYNNQGNYPPALTYYNKAVKAKQAINDTDGVGDATNNVGLVYWSQSNYPVALEYFLKSQNMYILVHDKKGQARTLNNIGLINMDEGNLDTAIYYFRQSLKIDEERKDTEGIQRAYNNIGVIYHQQEKYLSALDYFIKSFMVRKQEGDMDGVAVSYNNIAAIYDDMTHAADSVKERFVKTYNPHLSASPTIQEIDKLLLDSSLSLHQRALTLSKAVGDRDAIALSTQGIGSIYEARSDYKTALPYLLQAAEIEKEINKKKSYYELLVDVSNCYEKLGRTDSALSYFRHAMAIKDTVFNEEKQKAIGREEVKYEYEKKQALDEAENKKQHDIEEERRKRQNLIIYAGTLGIILLGVFLVFVMQRLRITRKQKSIIEKQKEQLGETLSELGTAKKELEEKHKDVTDSITYASRIQTALLTSEKFLSQNLKDYFIVFKPKDIVSGDFYWALNHNNKFYIACCDCTGHGVPGAFMSLLNITFLHQSVIEKEIVQPNQIFSEVRNNVIDALNPDGTSDTKDGMDAVLCAIDFEKHMLMASCANNALWIVRNNELIEFAPDKMPIGLGNDDLKAFTLHETSLHKGDCIYMFSDGYADQFGGADGKKFKKSQLKELIVTISGKPMKEQKSLLEKTFADWKGSQMQIDDVCVIGIGI
jgi:tetratricopeptide (TPR) repeat protein